MKKLSLLTFFIAFYSLQGFGQLTGMSNTSTVVGRTVLNTTITSNNAFIQGATPNGNVYQIELRQGSTILNLADGYSTWNVYSIVNVTSPSSLILSTFSIPYNAPLGSYSLYVGYQDSLLQGSTPSSSYFDSLPNAFTVLPPDGYIQGTVYDDLNLNGQRDPGEPGIQNGAIRIDAGSMNYPPLTDGTFSIPQDNGTHTVTFTRAGYDTRYVTGVSSYSATINNSNSTGNDFGVRRKLRFAVPNQVIAGQQISLTLIADTLFSPGTTYLYYVTFTKMSGGGNFYIYSNNISITDSNTASLLVSIPPSASGSYKAIVNIYSGTYYGYHYLDSVFTVIPSTASISGKTYFDQNNNGLYDAGEGGIGSQRVHLMPDDAYAFADRTGNYNIGAIPGSHTISWNPPGSTTFIMGTGPSSYTFTNTSPAANKDFGLRTTNPDYTNAVSLYSTRPRCNNYNTYCLTVANNSNIPFSGRVYFMRDSHTIWSGSTPAYSGSTASCDSIWWDLQNVNPFVPVVIPISLMMPGPGIVMHHSVYFVSYDAGSNPQLTSSTYLNETVRCGFDPNDKEVTPEGIGPDHLTQISDELEYRIRFQNTGNDTAFDVTIYDRLDTSLDWTTLMVTESSHSVQTTLDRTGQVRFYFRNINLPDSTTNEPGSNGFVTYHIRAKSTVPDYTVIKNTAYIVFDLNPAIITNTTMNTMVTAIPLYVNNSRPDLSSVTVYPNPLHDRAVFLFSNEDHSINGFELFDMTGQLLQRRQVTSNELVVEKDPLPVGIYLYRLTAEDGTIIHSGKIIVE